MGVEGPQAATVIDHDIPAVPASAPRLQDQAGGRSTDGVAILAVDIKAGVMRARRLLLNSTTRSVPFQQTRDLQRRS